MRILALDHGTKRIGIAISDELKMIAQPLEFVPASPLANVLARLKEVILEKISEMSGVDHGVISRAERGLRIPAMASIRDLAVTLGLDFADVVKNAEDRVRESF